MNKLKLFKLLMGSIAPIGCGIACIYTSRSGTGILLIVTGILNTYFYLTEKE